MFKQYLPMVFTAIIIGLAWVFLHGVAVGARQEVANRWDANNVLRLHILAHDNTSYEQELKLNVRDGIWQHINMAIYNAYTVEDAIAIIYDEIYNISAIAKELAQGQNAFARLLSSQHFPAMSYGSIILPRGDYAALQIVIGDGAGFNWWCVMFPPMCLMDVVKGEVIYDNELEEDEVIMRPRFWFMNVFRD